MAVVVLALAACTSEKMPPEFDPFPNDGLTPNWKPEFRKGVRAAQSDIKRGTLGWDGRENGEGDHERILWCFRKILRERYGVQFRLRGHIKFYDNLPRIHGYQSVMKPYLDARLGTGWYPRIWEEAEVFYREHWPEVERQFMIDLGNQLRAETKIDPPPTEEERLTADPMGKYYDYRDEKDGDSWRSHRDR